MSHCFLTATRSSKLGQYLNSFHVRTLQARMHQETLQSAKGDEIAAFIYKMSRYFSSVSSPPFTLCPVNLNKIIFLLGQDVFLYPGLLVQDSFILYHYFSLIVRLQNFTAQLYRKKMHHHLVRNSLRTTNHWLVRGKLTQSLFKVSTI